MNIRELDSATIVTDETGRGQFRIVDDTSGTVRYVFDPDVLAAHDENPAASRANWATYQPFPGAKPGSIVLFNRTKTAFTLDLSSNELTPFVADVSTPLGAMLQSDYLLERAVLLSPTSIVLRSRAQAE
jgi:hypothetical protein